MEMVISYTPHPAMESIKEIMNRFVVKILGRSQKY
jgi:hypothetical protein